jgi:CubicO group peptidase (beta-lactamase class C family)
MANFNIPDSLDIRIDRLKCLDLFLQKLIADKKHPFIGLRVLRRGTQIFKGDYGTQTPEGEPLRADAIYPTQSLTKPFTATCAAILQEDGLLDYFDPLQKHFPNFQGENKAGVLLWHLLCHSSGIDNDTVDAYQMAYFKQETGSEYNGIKNREERNSLVMSLRPKLGLPAAEASDNALSEVWDELCWRAPLAAKPGTKYSYNNAGYDAVKNLIERFSGKTLEEFARERIFEPLGMSDSHFFLPEEKRCRFVIRDEKFKGGAYMNSIYEMTSTSPSSGLKSTLDDLATFGQMFLQNGTFNGNRIISPASVRMMTVNRNKKIPDSEWAGRSYSSSWGLGWDTKDGKIDDFGFLRSERSYNHGGYGGARLMIDPDAELVVAMYMYEQDEASFYDDMGPAVNILYSALD